MKSFLFLILFTFLGSSALTQNLTVRGFVYDQSNGEPMGYEKVKILTTDSTIIAGAITDLNGFFQIPKLKKDKYILKISNLKYESAYQNIDFNNGKNIIDVKFELVLLQGVQEFEEVKVSAESKTKRTQIEISKLKLSKEGLERIPSYGAENDIVGAFSVTPGVITTGDQGGQLYVRGGTPIQNKILLDGMTIYNPFHSIGFFSVFETELIKNVDIYTGGFEAKYGGRISSIMDITYRDGNRKNFAGKVSASPFLAKMVLEGPMGEKKGDSPRAGSYIFSAKHSLLDYTSKELYGNVNEGNGLPFNFTDLYGKMTFTGDGGSKFSAFAFHNRDSVNYSVADLNWQSSGGGINFLLVPSSSPIFIRGHVNGSNFETTFAEEAQAPRTSSIGGFDLGFDFSYFLKNEGEMNYGFNINGFNTRYTTYNLAQRIIEDENFTTEIGGYYNYRRVGKRWVLQIGMRIQAYASLNTISPEPRIGAKYNASEKLRFKFSGGRFSQNFTSASSDKDIVNLFNGLLSAPTNVQDNFVNEFQQTRSIRNGLQYAWHGIAGVEYDLGKNIEVNIEAYYKYFSQLSNINQNKLYEDIAEFDQIDDVFKKDFIIESGQSYGIDFLLKYSKNRLFLWGVYSYGYNTRWDGFIEYFPVFDRRHNINLVGSYSFGAKRDIELNVRWNLGSGLPFTPTAGFFELESFNNGVTSNYVTNNSSSVSTILGEFNSERLPFYHRLDVTLKKQFKFKNKTIMEVVASVTNAYDRNNIFYVNRVTNDEIYQFPFLPSFGMSYKF
ncbi:MAG: TonB-dependent receptor [Flavobacteriales bacterium]|nr:MAG: TonB-dependent receptor [Flavobacteriales bacterium]